jgi:hypothetical protein
VRNRMSMNPANIINETNTTVVKFDPNNQEHAKVAQDSIGGAYDQGFFDAHKDTLHFFAVNGELNGNFTYEEQPGRWFVHEGCSARVPEYAPNVETALQYFIDLDKPEKRFDNERRKTFTASEDRSAFIDKHFADREALGTPGTYRLSDGSILSACMDELTHFWDNDHKPRI